MLKGVLTGIIGSVFVAGVATFFYGIYVGETASVTGAVIGGISAMTYVILLIVLSFVALFFSLRMFKKKKSLEY